MKNLRIRCPKCRWEPNPMSRWYCDKCRFEWNTFSTGGECPKCKHVHRMTQCVSCRKITPHADWYEDPDDRLGEEIREILEKEKV